MDRIIESRSFNDFKMYRFFYDIYIRLKENEWFDLKVIVNANLGKTYSHIFYIPRRIFVDSMKKVICKKVISLI